MIKSKTVHQTIESKKGEIEFRKKLVQQQVYAKENFKDEHDKQSIEGILKQRMLKTLRQFGEFKKEGALLSPYLEIGAERCQRSLVLENDLEISGASVDISFDMLKSCDYYKKGFNKNKAPVRICCDVNNLPFLTNSIPFVFCYQTLHHFPEPQFITKEIYRVLTPGGHFFFDEESYKRVLHVNLYKRRKINSRIGSKNNIFRKIADHFFAESNCNEVEYGIVENEDIPTRTWKNALSFFEKKDVKLLSGGFIESELFKPSSLIGSMLTYLLGGKISGICRKKGELPQDRPPISDILICPECIEKKSETRLLQQKNSFNCQDCGTQFPIKDDIIFLFTHKKLKELYPDVATF